MAQFCILWQHYGTVLYPLTTLWNSFVSFDNTMAQFCILWQHYGTVFYPLTTLWQDLVSCDFVLAQFLYPVTTLCTVYNRCFVFCDNTMYSIPLFCILWQHYVQYTDALYPVTTLCTVYCCFVSCDHTMYSIPLFCILWQHYVQYTAVLYPLTTLEQGFVYFDNTMASFVSYDNTMLQCCILYNMPGGVDKSALSLSLWYPLQYAWGCS